MVERHAMRALIVAASLAALVGACKPKLGAQCSAGQAACAEPKMGLFCGEDGTFHTMTCTGPAGCEQSGAVVNCDNGVAAHFVDDKLFKVVSTRPNAKAYLVKRGGDKVVEEAIQPEMLAK